MNARSRPLLFTSVTFAIVVVLVGGLSSQPPVPSPLTLLSKDGKRGIVVTIVNDQELVALDDLAAVFQLAIREESLGALTVSYKGKTIVLTPDQALASVAGRLVSLPAPLLRSGRRWLVPIEFISRVLAPIYDARLDLRKPSHLLVVGDLRVPRLAVRYDLFGTGGRLTIDATPRTTSAVTQENDRLTIKFDADALDVASPPLPPQGAQSLVQSVRVVDAATLAVELGPRFRGFRASAQPVDTTTRLVVDIVTAQAEIQAAPTPPPARELPPALAQPTSAIRTIAIDPGHGGDDEGVKGADGVKEKDLTLTVGRRVKTIIEARLGIRVLLTRDDDRNVPVDDRTAVANNNKADLFVSLHANASFQTSAAGASIYYAAFDDDAVKAAGAAGAAERVPTQGGGSREIEILLWDLAQTRHLKQSTAFSTILEQRFRDRVPLASRPVGRAPLRVLTSANMPAVLIEMGFLSNPDQEKRLTGAEFQNAFAQALFDAVLKFRDTLSTGGPR